MFLAHAGPPWDLAMRYASSHLPALRYMVTADFQSRAWIKWYSAWWTLPAASNSYTRRNQQRNIDAMSAVHERKQSIRKSYKRSNIQNYGPPVMTVWCHRNSIIIIIITISLTQYPFIHAALMMYAWNSLSCNCNRPVSLSLYCFYILH